MAIKIYIDQGHNPYGPNAGAEGNGLREQDITYIVGRYLYDLLSANPNFEAKLSRENSQEILGNSNATSLQTRVRDANTWGADYFISLHTNASVIESASGSEAFVFRRDSDAEILAGNILEQLNFATGLTNRGVFARPGLYVLRRTRMPAVLTELGFITNPVDAELMAYSPQLFASGVTNGILAYLGML